MAYIPYRRAYAPRTQSRAAFSAAAALRRSSIAKARNLSRFRAITAGRRTMGLPASRGFRPLGLRGTGEKKVIDVAAGTIQINTTGSFNLLNGCVQGSDYSNRIGRKIVMRSLYIRGFAFPEPSATAANSPSQQARMIIFLDSQPNGAAPAVTDLLNSATPASQLNLNNRDRFRVLRDQTFVFGPQVYAVSATAAPTVTGTPSVADVNCYVKMGHETIFNAGNAGTIGDINSGALYMFWIGSVTAGTGQDANAFVSSRVRFLDP